MLRAALKSSPCSSSDPNVYQARKSITDSPHPGPSRRGPVAAASTRRYRAGHLERIEDSVELLAGEHFIPQDEIANRCSGEDRFARNARGRLVAHVRVDG